MPQKQKSWSQLKQAGNECFKKGQYGEATAQYNQAIKELEKSSTKNLDDLAVLYSNRAASFLKDGNCCECVKDCNTSLELSPFNVKSLLRRAAAQEALERYRQAYVDYKTALQIDCNIASAHEGTNRMSKALSEADGPSWRDKLPAIPSVPMSVKEKIHQQSSGGGVRASPQQQQQQQPVSSAVSSEQLKKAQALKEEGNALVKKGQHKKAVEKYSQSLKLNPAEGAVLPVGEDVVVFTDHMTLDEVVTKLLNGRAIHLMLVLTSDNTVPRSLTLNIRVQGMLYNGTVVTTIQAVDRQAQLLPRTELKVPIKVPFSVYHPLMPDFDNIRVSVIATDKLIPDEPYLAEDNLVLLDPPLRLIVLGDVRLLKPTRVELIFKNPSKETLTNCSMTVNGSGLLRDEFQFSVPDIKVSSRVRVQISLFPYRTGTKKLLADFDCDQFKDIKGSLTLNVTY